MNDIPIIDIGALFDNDPAARSMVDNRIAVAAFDIGATLVTRHPAGMRVGPAERAVMLKLFDLPMAVQRPLRKRNFAREPAYLSRLVSALIKCGAQSRGIRDWPICARHVHLTLTRWRVNREAVSENLAMRPAHPFQHQPTMILTVLAGWSPPANGAAASMQSGNGNQSE